MDEFAPVGIPGRAHTPDHLLAEQLGSKCADAEDVRLWVNLAGAVCSLAMFPLSLRAPLVAFQDQFAGGLGGVGEGHEVEVLGVDFGFFDESSAPPFRSGPLMLRPRCASSRSARISASRRRTASRSAQGSGGATLLALPITGPVGGLSRKYAH